MDKKFYMVLMGLFAFIGLAGGISYSYFVYNKKIVEVDLSSGEINIGFTNSNSVLNLT